MTAAAPDESGGATPTDAAPAPTSTDDMATTTSPPAVPTMQIVTEPAQLLANLAILPPRQKQARSSAALAEAPIALPPLRAEEPVASLRAALSELIGYAALSKYRLVVERLDDDEKNKKKQQQGGGSAAAANKVAKNGNDATAASASGGNGGGGGGSKKRGKNRGGGSNNRGAKSKANKAAADDAPCHSPYALVDAEVSSPPSPSGMAGGGTLLSSNADDGKDAKEKGARGGEDDDELVLDEFGDLTALLPLLTNTDDDEAAATEDATATANVLDASRLAIRIVLEPYDAASVREQVGRVRALFGGNAPCVASLVGEQGEAKKETTKEKGEEKGEAKGEKAKDAKEDKKKKEAADDANKKEEEAKPKLPLLPSGHDILFESSAGAGDLTNFYRFACGDERAANDEAMGAGNGNGNGEDESKEGSGGKRGKKKSKGRCKALTDADIASLVVDDNSIADVERLLYDLNESAKVPATVRFGGYHPPPAHRRVLGDLAYLEAAMPDGSTVHVTAFALGFYVNKSNKDRFDPTPVGGSNGSNGSAVDACYSHSLLDCLLQRSKSLRAAWRAALAASHTRSEVMARLSVVEDAPTALLRASSSPFAENGPGVGAGGVMAPAPTSFAPRIDSASARPMWLVPMPSAEHGMADDGRKVATYDHDELHAYDPYRAEDELTNAHGMTDVGVRDWNEELQAAREMPVENLADRIERARLIHKVMTDFGDAALRGVKAIVDGHILPMNPSEPPRSHVHLHDNIFFSRALDPGPDTFKIVQGDGAARKTASRDAHNTGVLHRLDVPGLHTLATVLVEYAGMRLVCQSVVPGILHGERSHTLLCGAVETLSALRCDDEMHKLLEGSIGRDCMVATRNVPAHPLTDERMEVIMRHRIAAPDPLPGVEEKEDEEDKKDKSVQVCGPVEMKGIQGSDGRKYVLDCTRLTPRDANWVAKASGGTGKWEELQAKTSDVASELVPSSLEDDEWTACVLRPELVTSYAEMKIGKFLKESSSHGNGGKEGEKEAAEKKDDEPKKPDANTEEDKEWVDIASKKAAEQSKEAKDSEAVANKVEEEYIRSLRYNVNVFLPFTRSIEIIDSESHEELKKDEEEARNLARHLWDTVIPGLTKDIRKGGGNGLQLPVEGRSLTEMIHQRGINCRYLGRLAELARKEELEDVVAEKRAETARAVAEKLKDSADKSKVEVTAPRFRMPLCWLEQLECEMVARAAKHVLNSYLTERRMTRPAAQTIASFLSAVVSIGEESAAETEVRMSKDGSTLDQDEVSALTLFDVSGGDGGNGKGTSSIRGRAEIWADIEQEIARRFRYTLSLYNGGSAKKDGSEQGGRALYMGLLRRICQRSGIRLVARRYNVGKKCVCGGGGLAASYPIAPTDILDILPLVKHGASVAGESFVPCPFGANVGSSSHSLHILLPEAKTAYELGHANMQSGNASLAVECAREASSMYQRVVDTPVHPQVAGCFRLMAAACLHGDDAGPALAAAERYLSVSTSLYGFDSPEALRARLSMVDIFLGVGRISDGVKHLRAAQFLMELLGGKNFAGLASLYFRLGSIYYEAGNLENALRFFQASSRRRSEDRIYECLIARNSAGVLARMGLFKPAFDFEKKAYQLYATILGEDHDGTKSVSNSLVHLMNLAIEQEKQSKAQAKERKKEKAADAVAEAIKAEEEQAEEAAKPKKKKKKKKGKK